VGKTGLPQNVGGKTPWDYRFKMKKKKQKKKNKIKKKTNIQQ